MEPLTTSGSRWAEEAVYTDWYPRVVAVAHRLVARRGLFWPSNSTAFRRVVRQGSQAANAALARIEAEAPDAWAELSRSGRVAVAVRTASRAMAQYLRAMAVVE